MKNSLLGDYAFFGQEDLMINANNYLENRVCLLDTNNKEFVKCYGSVQESNVVNSNAIVKLKYIIENID